jgi:hypothetical protein
MLNKKTIIALLAGVTLLAAGTAWAKVSPAEAEKLKGELTPLGAERAGNADGSIPAWEGGITGIPAGIDYKPGDIHPDPFKDDKVLFSITAANVDQYADKMSKGATALLQKYPDMRLDVYPTRRTASAPQRVYDNTFKAATQCETTPDGLGVVNNGVVGAIPFPLPQKAEEVMFNHLLRWRGLGTTGNYKQFSVQNNGKLSSGGGGMLYEKYPWFDPNTTADNFSGIYYELLVKYMQPTRRNGEIALVVDPLNQSTDPRKAWQYLPGQRRVRRAPSISYDTPNPAVSGLGTYDDVFLFNGALDRYDWKLVGKQELYIPYNTYDFDLATIEEVATPNYPNPDHFRWELHRVWVVEATLKDGKRHAYAKRTFYIDEDTWIGVMADNYDGRGNLWRLTWQSTKNAYELPGVVNRNYIHFDLTRDDWAFGLSINDKTKMFDYSKAEDDKFFTPESVRRLGKR